MCNECVLYQFNEGHQRNILKLYRVFSSSNKIQNFSSINQFLINKQRQLSFVNPFILFSNEKTNYYATLALSRPFNGQVTGQTSPPRITQRLCFCYTVVAHICRVPLLIFRWLGYSASWPIIMLTILIKGATVHLCCSLDLDRVIIIILSNNKPCNRVIDKAISKPKIIKLIYQLISTSNPSLSQSQCTLY